MQTWRPFGSVKKYLAIELLPGTGLAPRLACLAFGSTLLHSGIMLIPELGRPFLQKLLTDQDIHYPQERPGSLATGFLVWGLWRRVKK